ncbi:T9SS type A sorting domain-containing protein [Flavobacterium sangjuense]|nr:T9SS type A sorting domain-containing protein [Flavobacterium sangjuense]
MSTAQQVTTVAGSTQGFADGPVATAQFFSPLGVAVDAGGNLYVADGWNNKIRKITPAGIVSTLAGSTQGFSDGAGGSAQFYHPFGVATDTAGNVYVADTENNKIRKITPAGVVSTLAGSGTCGFLNGSGATAQFCSPTGVVTDATGNVYVADLINHRIRKITPTGVVSTLAGGATYGFADGSGTAAKFNAPRGVTIDAAGNVYVADSENNKIRKITPAGMVSTLAGSTVGFADGTGSAAQFYYPFGVATDPAGNLYVADAYNNKIRKITPTGVVSTLAGSTQGFADGAGVSAQFHFPEGVAIDSAGNIYIGDQSNERIRKITQQLGVTHNNIDSKITVYPNPVTTVLTLQLENDCSLDKISITDLSGKIILQTQNSNTINVENLAKGIYIMEAYSGEDKYVSKFVKE